MIDRREFLQNSALISLAPWMPAFLPGSFRAEDAKKEDRILVVIQLDGGNDGLNTVVPFADENYARARRELRFLEKDVLKLNDSIGLHRGMKDAAELFHEGQLAIIQGVGYPNPNRSHFESMAIWHSASLNSHQHDNHGWLGRAADAILRPDKSVADSVYIGHDEIPSALRGRRAKSVSLEKESDLRLLTPLAGSKTDVETDDLAAFVTRIQNQSFKAARQFDQSEQQRESATYPTTGLGRNLQLISRLIKMDGGTRVFYVSQGSYDTHSAQAEQHRQLLTELSGGIRAFLKDLKSSELSDRVVVLAFSEFGRRVQENNSLGTDHGAAGPVFVAGESVHGGLIGDHPSLSDLDAGDLKMSVDFRSVYATLLNNWLRVDATPVLGGEFPTIEFLKV